MHSISGYFYSILIICLTLVSCISSKKTIYTDEEAISLLGKQVNEIAKSDTLIKSLILKCDGDFLQIHKDQCHLQIPDSIMDSIHTYCSNNYSINVDSVATKVFYIEMLVLKNDKNAKIIYDLITCKPACVELSENKIDKKNIDCNIVYLYYLFNISEKKVEVYSINKK